ncbi:MAG: hypothetical protein AAF959_15445 [Cyanobacteria bacterium P01_D01_bin.56]
MASSQDKSPVPDGTTPNNPIAPQLERALQNLNVNLEDELTRYRRQRHGRVPPPPPPRRKAQRQTIDLISVSAEPAVSPPPPPSAAAPPTPPPPPPNPFLRGEPTPDSELELPDMDQLLDPQQLEEPDLTADENSAPTDAGLPVHATDTAPEGYLESSEELLKSLADEQTAPESVPEPYSPDRKSNSLLKLAGLVLVLLAGIGVGFAITYPSQLQRLRSQLFPGSSSPDTTTTEAETEASSTSGNPEDTTPSGEADTSAGGYKPPGPDLSQREFVELDLESLSTLDVDGTTPSAPVPPLSNPAQSPLPQPGTTPSTNQNEQTTDNTIPSPTEPAATNSTATPTPTTSAAAPTPAPTATGSNFYVVASYTGDDSLNKAREFVPDAFIRNFNAGARIQLAAFDNQAQAEDQVAALTQQGMTVELFGPTNE